MNVYSSEKDVTLMSESGCAPCVHYRECVIFAREGSFSMTDLGTRCKGYETKKGAER